MNNDLISRSELKKAIEKETCNFELPISANEIMPIIDNAPTVEDKPQGEWIYDEKLFNWKCSQCFESPKTLGYVGNRDFMNEHFKFCNHCGARMKGGEE